MNEKIIIPQDTIAAIATPQGKGGIGIIRISGPDALKIGKKIFQRKILGAAGTEKHENQKDKARCRFQPRTLYLGHIVDPETKNVVDEVLAVFMRAPHSYTCEDIFEIQAHAGKVGLDTILKLVFKSGARLAEPGEFTKRAFLNGRIDLTQAEAIIDIINAKTEKSLRMAMGQLHGSLRIKSETITQALMALLAEVEADIDFPDETEGVVSHTLTHEKCLNSVILPLEELLKNFNEGHVLRDGLKVVILGRPNVGKSSLMNLLLNKERAIVTPTPGTTRDTIEEELIIDGLAVTIVDTAGVRRSEDPIECAGVKRSHRQAQGADLILFMIDASDGITEEDLEIFQPIKETRIVVVINKIDLEDREQPTEIPEPWETKETVRMSVRYEQGLDLLKSAIYRSVMQYETGEDERIVPTIRQRGLIQQSLDAAKLAIAGVESGTPAELIAMDLKDAIGALRQLVGDESRYDILDEIFRHFCIGK